MPSKDVIANTLLKDGKVEEFIKHIYLLKTHQEYLDFVKMMSDSDKTDDEIRTLAYEMMESNIPEQYQIHIQRLKNATSDEEYVKILNDGINEAYEYYLMKLSMPDEDVHEDYDSKWALREYMNDLERMENTYG
jgi:hypothetical protein